MIPGPALLFIPGFRRRQGELSRWRWYVQLLTTLIGKVFRNLDTLGCGLLLRLFLHPFPVAQVGGEDQVAG